MTRFKILAMSVALVFVVAGCGNEADDSTPSGSDSQTEADERSSDEGGFGEAASPDEATKTVTVTTLDELAFDPSSVSVRQGDVVRFVVTNKGKAPHEFVIGDEAYQEEHAQAMEHGGHGGADLGNVVEVAPGSKDEVTWRFTAPGEVLFACHVQGHYEGGMVGTIHVEA